MRIYEPWNSETILPGQRYGRYLVLSTHKAVGTYDYFAYCQCECGSAPRYVSTRVLRNKTTSSCGCLHKEAVTKHGAWNHPLCAIWRAMKSRCENPKDKRFARYGGRGIKVCNRWSDVNVFISDMNPSFRKGLRIERIDNNKSYSKKNCRWATTKEQNRNYSRNATFTLNGKTMCLTEWTEVYGIKYQLAWDRIRRGWDLEKALTTPSLKNT